MAGTMSQADLVADLKASLQSAADKFTAPDGADFKRFLGHAAADFNRAQRRVLEGSLTLVADQAGYPAPADYVCIHLPQWGKAERQRYKPWDPLYPVRLPQPHTVEGLSGLEIHLSPAPTAAQINQLGATWPFLYVARHKVDANAANTTIAPNNRGVLLLRAQAEAMKELAIAGVVQPIQFHKGMGSAPTQGTPSALHKRLMEEFVRAAA